MAAFEYPQARRDETVVEDYHGTKVADPYRYLEDPDSEETKQFVENQNSLTMPYIRACEQWETIKQELTNLWNFEKYSCPSKEGDKYFFNKNTGLQNQSVLYVQDNLEDEPRVFLDPNTLAEDGTISLQKTSWSEDGKVMAYSLSQSGSDWVTVKFRNVSTGEDYPDTLEKVKFTSLAWTHDNKGLFYNCYPNWDVSKAQGKDATSLECQTVFYHVLGTTQDKDVLCVEWPEHPQWMSGCVVSDCGRYLIVTPSQECKYNLLYYCDLEALGEGGIQGKLDLVPIVAGPQFEADYDYITNLGSRAVFKTNRNAQNFKLITIDLDRPAETNWVDLVGNQERDVLEWAAGVAGDRLVTCYMQDVKNVLQLRDLRTGDLLHNFKLDIGSVTGFSGHLKHNELFFKFSSQITPGIIYHVDLATGAPQPPVPRVHITTKVHNFNPDEFSVNQVFYPSADGTQVPMFIIGRRDLVNDGSSPCLLYGYGGFNHSLTPSFSLPHTFFVQHFGIVAVANIRGGGEYGESWQNAGRQENLQNILTDFQCAAEYLVRERYTAPAKLTINGGSHGGMLVGACANQRPDLFGAAVNEVGVMDLLRFHKFTVGYAWISNYGCSDNEKDFRTLYGISPLHNIRVPEGLQQYPAVLSVTADHDDRVVPSHSLKYIATLQHTLGSLPQQTNPLLIRLDTKAGHGAGKPTSKYIEEYTDIFCFLIRALGIQYRK